MYLGLLGSPKTDLAWKHNVKWVTGDLSDKINWPEELQGATGVVSCVGAFGTNEVLTFILCTLTCVIPI